MWWCYRWVSPIRDAGANECFSTTPLLVVSMNVYSSWCFLSQYFQQKLRGLYLTIKTESKIAKDYMEVGNQSMQYYVQPWNNFQRCPWQLKVITLWDNKNLNRDLSRILALWQIVMPLPSPHLTFSCSTGYKLLISFFPLEDKHLITSPLFWRPYCSIGSKHLYSQVV